uniref:Uncharacterized protein n=1 Tax=Romanomermis culicivorax TaxID=13658 RepID=A0A915KD72_ROMCU
MEITTRMLRRIQTRRNQNRQMMMIQQMIPVQTGPMIKNRFDDDGTENGSEVTDQIEEKVPEKPIWTVKKQQLDDDRFVLAGVNFMLAIILENYTMH